MMYEFVDTNERAKRGIGAIQTIFNDINLDEYLIDSFKTLNVTGRGLIAPEIEYTDKVGGAGAWFDSIRLPAREIILQAKITATSNEESRRTYNQINRILNVGVRRLEFTDESESYFMAALAGISEETENSNDIVVEISFMCSDPYKYGDVVKTSSVVPSDVVYPTTPDKVTVTLASAVTSVKVTNQMTGDNFVINGNYASGDVITFEFMDDPVINQNGASILDELDIASDYETFNVLAGDVVSVVPSSATLEIELRRKLL